MTTEGPMLLCPLSLHLQDSKSSLFCVQAQRELKSICMNWWARPGKINVTFFNNSWTIFLVIEVQLKLGKIAHDVLGTGEQGVWWTVSVSLVLFFHLPSYGFYSPATYRRYLSFLPAGRKPKTPPVHCIKFLSGLHVKAFGSQIGSAEIWRTQH